MNEEEFTTINIHIKWLENIYEEIRILQDLERMSKEGCRSIIEYFQIPFELQKIIIPDTQYKNLRFFALELDILITNISSVLKEKEIEYRKRLSPVLKSIENRSLFLKEKIKNGQIVAIEVLPMLYKTIDYLSKIKADLIKDIEPILYLPKENKKEW